MSTSPQIDQSDYSSIKTSQLIGFHNIVWARRGNTIDHLEGFSVYGFSFSIQWWLVMYCLVILKLFLCTVVDNVATWNWRCKQWLHHRTGLDIPFRKVSLLAILKRNISSNFLLWVLVNMWVQFLKKTSRYQPFKIWHFVRVCMEKMKNDGPSI